MKFITRDIVSVVVNPSRCTLEAAGLVRPPVTESGKTGGEVRARDGSAGCASSSSALRKETPVIYSHNPPFTTHIQHVQACAEQPVRFGAQGRIRTSILPSCAVPRRGIFKKLTQSSRALLSDNLLSSNAATFPFTSGAPRSSSTRYARLLEGLQEDTGTDSSLSMASRSPRAMSLTTQRRPRR